MKSKIIKKVLSGILSVSLMLQMGMPAVYAEENNPIQEIKSITAFEDLAEEVKNITVPVGTLEEELPLPQIVKATVERTVYEKVTVDSSNPPEEQSNKTETTEPVDSKVPESGNPVDTSADSNAVENDSESSNTVETPVAENDSESGNTVETPAATEETKTTIEENTSLPLDTPSLDSGSTKEIEPKTELVEKKTTENVELNVIWESDKTFSSETANTFTYTAKLTDEGYTLSVGVGVEMPKITVTIFNKNKAKLLSQGTDIGGLTVNTISGEYSTESGYSGNTKMPSVDGNWIFANGTPLLITGDDSRTTIYIDTNANGVLDNGEKSLAESGIPGAPSNNEKLSTHCIFGGSNRTDVQYNTHIVMTGGYISSLYGGCITDIDAGSLTGDTYIKVTGGTIKEKIKGGSSSAGGKTLTGNTTVIVTGGTARYDVNGGCDSGTVTGNKNGIVTSTKAYEPSFTNGFLKTGDNTYIAKGTITLPSDFDFTLPTGSTLTVQENATIINQGKITLKGDMVNNGTFTNDGTVKNEGGSYSGSGAWNGTPMEDLKLTVSTAKEITDSSAKVTVNCNKDATVYYLASETQISDTSTLETKGSSQSISANTDYDIVLDNLTSNTLYTYYMVVKVGEVFTDIKAVDFTTLKKSPNLKLKGTVSGKVFDDTPISHSITKGDLFTWDSEGALSFTYFTDSNGTKTTTANSGVANEGGVPKNAGTYYLKAVLSDNGEYAGAESDYVQFTIAKSATEFTGGIKTYKDNTEANTFNYGDTITVKVTPKATGTKPVTNGLKMARSFSAPTLNQMALFVGETQITEPQTVISGQELTYTYDTTGTNVITPDIPVDIKAKYVGNSNMADYEQDIEVTVNAVAEVTKGSTVSYESTLQGAFGLIGSGETGTIKILKDIDLGENGVTQAGGSTVTFDLNGCTVKHSKNDSSAITIYSSDITKLTVKSSIDGGTLLESGTNSKAINNAIGKGEVIIESGLIRSTGSVGGKAIYNANKLTVNGGILDTLKNGFSIMNAENTAILEVNGGIVKSVSEAIYNKYGTVSISGGTVLGKVAIDNGASGTVNYAKGIILGDCTGDGTYTEGNPQWLAKGTATLLIDAEIPSSKTFTVSKDANFTIKDGTTLTNNGTLVLNGKINGTGTLSGTGEFKTSLFTTGDIQDIPDQTYTGNVIEPEVTINSSILGKKFTVDLTDYTKSYENNTNVGTAKVVFTNENDKIEKNFNIVKSGTTFDGGIKTYKDNTATNIFNYGDTITVKVTPKATSKKPVTNGLKMARSFSAPTTNQMALFVGEKRISDAVSADQNGVYTMTYDTKTKDLVIGDNTITAKYVGNSNMADYSENVIVTLNKKTITSVIVNTSDASASKEYNGTNSFTGVALTTFIGVESSDTVKATADGTVTDVNVGTGKAFTATSVTLDSKDKDYYSIDKMAVSGNVSITQASAAGIDQELQAVKGLAKEYTFDLNKLLPEFSTGKSFGDIAYTVGTVTNTDKVLAQAPANSDIKGGKITLKVGNVVDKDKTAVIQIKVASKNYKDFTANLNLKTIDKTPLTIEAVFTGGTYNGKPYVYTGTPTFKNGEETVAGITYTAKYAGRDGTIYDESEMAPTNAGKYNLILTVSGKSANTYAGTITIGFEITKKQITAKPNDVSIESNASFPAYTWSINTGITGESITATNVKNVAMQAQENGTKLTAVKVGTFDIVFTTAPTFNSNGDIDKNYDIQIGKGTLTVTKYNSHEDSSNEGGSSNGGGSYYNGNKDNGTTVITPPVTPDKTNLPTQTTITVPSTVKNGTANVIVSQSTVESAISKAQVEAKKKGTEKNGIAVEFKVDTKNSIANSLSVNLPKTSLDKLLKAEVKDVYINSSAVTIKLNLETLKTIYKEINDDINVSAQKLDNKTLSAEAKAIVGNHPVFDLTIIGKNSKKATDFGKGKVSVSIPYTLGSKEKAGNVVAYYIDNTGKVHEMPNSVYDEQSKTLMFVTNHFSKFSVGYKEDKVTTFTDISNHWAKEVIEFATARGLFRETEKDKFSPNASITRGMFVTALGKLAGVNVSSYKSTKFTDVKGDSYYLPYIEWASKNGILVGTSVTTFAPDQGITREQMAVIMTNYSKTMGFELPKAHTENNFADNAKVGNYAKTAVKQMQMAGVLAGKNSNKLDPQGIATRAEGSAVLKRFVEIVIKSNIADGWMQNDNGRWLYYKNGKALTGKHIIDGVSYEFNSYGETTTEPSFTFKTYIVQKGDCLKSIAHTYKVNIYTLIKVINKDILNILHVGDVLKIPQK